MGNARGLSALLAAAGFMVSGAAQAALFDRGGGLLYDDVLNVTWLQDANYAKTSGYDADGRMNWSESKAWAASLSYRGYTDWRLARNSPVGSDWNSTFSYDGTTDYGFNITSPNSELAYMYYVNLGLKGDYSQFGTYQPDWGIFRNGTCNGIDCNPRWGQADVGLVKNLQSYQYWSVSAYMLTTISYAWQFSTLRGFQGWYDHYSDDEWNAWAVRDGDVAAVPEPETYATFLAGLAVMGGALRRRAGKAG